MQAAAATWQLDERRVAEFYERARADRWQLPMHTFAAQLELSAQRAFPGGAPERRELDRYLASLHLEDLALACACAEGIDTAWDHFVLEYRPALYRAADAIDRSGNAREFADSLYGELFGLTSQGGQRQSHFRYFHGRSSLATWLRAVLAQRYVDGVRRVSRTDPLPDEESPNALAAPASSAHHLELPRYHEMIRRAMTSTIGALAPRDRLRLRCYYAQDLTLAQIAKLLDEHEATVSRNLAKTRRTIRDAVEARLRANGMKQAEMNECVTGVLSDPGMLDLAQILADDSGGSKKLPLDRSQ